MSTLTLAAVEKEISDATASIASQHSQCQWYFHTYLAAITGLFALAAFFAKDGQMSRPASAVGVIFSLIIFFIGWAFLSIVAHKASMITMLYKHLAAMRAIRLNILPVLKVGYVFPSGKAAMVQAGMISQLPYLFFAFNFALLASAVYYFIQPHNLDHQTVAVVTAFCVTLGTFYPVVCISFNKHMRCALKAKNLLHKQQLEYIWSDVIAELKKKTRIKTRFILTFANTLALLLAFYAYVPQTRQSETVVTVVCVLTVIGYAWIRFRLELSRFKLAGGAIVRRHNRREA